MSDAVLSPDGMYRYHLERDTGLLAPTNNLVTWIMLNPSTADATADDPTIRRVIGFSAGWGFGRLAVVNLFAYRATQPGDLWDAAEAGIDPVGEHNDQWTQGAAAEADMVLCAWGSHGDRTPRTKAVMGMLADMQVVPHCLGVTKSGQPRHPLYLPKNAAVMTYYDRT